MHHPDRVRERKEKIGKVAHCVESAGMQQQYDMYHLLTSPEHDRTLEALNYESILTDHSEAPKVHRFPNINLSYDPRGPYLIPRR